ncbi:hypothetical protein EVB39_034 [Rhizobium phage RHph_TM3_3_9]|nr:hypothetical protein EVB39_034 [Rhizobium phage RHph_TM3_3_9]QIG68555.1 hypothetical protein EVB66_034 [Rhizobium phage RHph_TM3_3_13]QIG74413.1 hypothetical protein EVC09_033 [Rhizobium phage RHph_TM3_3_10]QXV74527.1 hypothetical protein [Rhizobium phage RHEph19]
MSEITISESTRIGEQNAVIAFYQHRSAMLAQLVVNSAQEVEKLRARVQELETVKIADQEEIENLRIEIRELSERGES